MTYRTEAGKVRDIVREAERLEGIAKSIKELVKMECPSYTSIRALAREAGRSTAQIVDVAEDL